MTRPAGDPGQIAAAGHAFAAAAAALADLRALLQAAAFDLVTTGVWQGPASTAFTADVQSLLRDLRGAALGLEQASAGLARLAGQLEQAQALWSEAEALAAAYDIPFGPDGPVTAPSALPDLLHIAEAGRIAEVVEQAGALADEADRSAGACLRAVAGMESVRVGAAGSPAGPQGGDHLAAALRAGGLALDGVDQVGRATEETATALHGVVTRSADPAVRVWAGQAAEAVSSVGDGRLLHALSAGMPVIGAALRFTAALAEGDRPGRAAARALGAGIGGELGVGAGSAACAGVATATEGVGAVACPLLVGGGGLAGAHLGDRLGARAYDALAPVPRRWSFDRLPPDQQEELARDAYEQRSGARPELFRDNRDPNEPEGHGH